MAYDRNRVTLTNFCRFHYQSYSDMKTLPASRVELDWLHLGCVAAARLLALLVPQDACTCGYVNH